MSVCVCLRVCVFVCHVLLCEHRRFLTSPGMPQEALEWYRGRMAALEDRGRYLYMLVRTKSANDGAATRIYKRYKLADAKVCNWEGSGGGVGCCV